MNPSQLSQLLSVSISEHEPILVKGPPGCGKSDIINSAAVSAQADSVMFHGVTSDPTDAKGIGWVERTNEGLRADFVPFGDLLKLMAATRPTVAFLDDFGQAAPAVQASFMQLVLARQIGEHKVSDHVTFIAATNRKQDRAAVAGILEPVKSRFTIVELEPDLDDWCKWALAAGLPIEVVAYARFKPDCILDYEPTADITNACCPRTLATAARWVARGLPGSARAGAAKGGKWQGMEFEALAGSIGEGRAAELCGFLQVWRSLPNIDQIIMSPKTAPVPPADEAGTLYALAGLLARRATQANFGSICQYMGRLPKDHGVLTMKMSTQKAPEVMQTAAYIQWAADNQDVML